MCVCVRDGHGWGKTEDYTFVTVSYACLLHVSTVLPSPLSPLESFSTSVYRKNITYTFSENTRHLLVKSQRHAHLCNTQFVGGNSIQIVKTSTTHSHAQHTHTSIFPKMFVCGLININTNNRFPSICAHKKKKNFNTPQPL